MFFVIETNEVQNDFNKVAVSGSFRFSDSDIKSDIFNKSILKHIVVVVTYSSGHNILTPFSDAIVFSDDIKIESGEISGAFYLELSDYIKMNEAQECYVLCSLYTHLSNILKISKT